MAGWASYMLLSLAILPLTMATPLGTSSPAVQEPETDNPHTRKLLGSSVVTSVSVIMDHGNGTKTYITDGNAHTADTGQLGRPPQAVGTPGTLLAPDRYEFYTFGKEGELVKKLMTLDQIQSLIAAAGGEEEDDLSDQPVYYHQPLVEAGDSEGVSKVLESVHNVLKGELEAAAAAGQHSAEVPLLPDQSWTILLPGLLNNDMDFKDSLSTATKKPSPTTSSPLPTTSPPATTRFPPRKTTTTTSVPSSQQPHKPVSTSYHRPTQTTPYNKLTTSKLPINQQTSHLQQPVASSSILTPQYSSFKPPPSKLTTPSVLDTTTTVKYSAHYTTPHPTVPPKQTTHYAKPQHTMATSKPGGISVKKPILSSHSSTKTTPTTTSPTTPSPENITQSTAAITTAISSVNTTPRPTTTKKPTTTTTTTAGPTITTYKTSTTSPLMINSVTKQPTSNNITHKTTTQFAYKPTTYRPSTSRPQPEKYTQNQRPSGIPTIVHYLPMHSMSPSHAPVNPTTPAKVPLESINQTKLQSTKLTTLHQTTKPANTSPTTINDNTVASTFFEEQTTVPSTDKEFQEITAQRFPSTASIATKNHYTVINSIKSSPTVKPVNRTQTVTTNYGNTNKNSEANASAAPLVAAPSALPMHTIPDEESINTVSVVTIFEDTTRPMEIMTIAKIQPNASEASSDTLIQSTTAMNQLESFSTVPTTTSTTPRPSTRPSTLMVQISTKPPYSNNTTMTPPYSHYKPTSTKPTVIHRRTTTTASPPPKRGSVSYTPIPQLYKTTPPSLRQPVKTTFAPSIQTRTPSRPSTVAITEERRPVSATTSTTKKSTIPSTTTTYASTTTPTTTELTTTLPPETTTDLTKIPLEQLPLKLIENLKDSNKQTIYELPPTIYVDNYSTLENQDSSTISVTETTTTETTDLTAATTLSAFPAKIVILNNSEPFIVNHSSSEQEVSRLPPSEALTLTQTTTYTTLPSTVEYSTVDSGTTTMEPATTYKDQILEEGINAVTSILLDGDQKKEFLLNMTRPLGLFNNTFITTTEDEQNVTEDNTTTELVTQSEEKSETRVDEVELTEDYLEAGDMINIMSTTQREEGNNFDKDYVKISTEVPVHSQVKKHVQNEVKNALSEETKIRDNNINQNNKTSTIKANDQDLKAQLSEKLDEAQIGNKSKINDTKPAEILAPSEETKKLTNTKPNSQEIMKKPTQQEIKKQPNEEVKRPTLTKTKLSIQKPNQEKVNSTKEILKEATEDEADDSKIPVQLKIKEQTSDDSKKPHVVPTKESKLNPDIVEEPAQMVEVLQDSLSALTAAPFNSAAILTTDRPIIHEQIKLQEVDKNGNGFNKFNSKRPVYQPPPQELSAPPAAIDLHPAPYESMGLEASTAFLAEDIRRFADLCNELAFKLWSALTSKGQISSRSLVMSPFAVTSLLAMVFLGARGTTSGQMNDILRLDDMVTFNPHQVFQNVTESVLNSKTKGVATAAFVRQLYSDKSKGKLLDFYKERAQQYYQGHVEEINFSTVGDIIRRRTNLLVKRQTLGKVAEYLRGSSLNMKPPLAAFSANIFQTDCELGSTEGRDGEMYFVVRPSTRQRRLVPVPAVVWRYGFLAGYEPSLDATSVCLGPDSVVSTILILPGQQGQVAPGDGLARLEQRLIETNYRRGAWSRLLRSQLSRPGLELQVPRFSHRSVLNVTGALTRMGLRNLFGTKADLRGLNGLSNDLHLSDMVQVNTFSTCGEETVGARHHVETYPASPQRTGRDDADIQPSTLVDMLHDYRYNSQQWNSLPMALRPRQARLPDNPRLRFDRPFLYVVRHNPSGIILHMGRFNPRLLP